MAGISTKICCLSRSIIIISLRNSYRASLGKVYPADACTDTFIPIYLGGAEPNTLGIGMNATPAVTDAFGRVRSNHKFMLDAVIFCATFSVE